MSKSNKIQSTKNYRLFKHSAENRPLDMVRHKKLIDSMKEYGFLKCYPIVVVKTEGGLEVKDGQHRLATAEALGLYVYYVEEEVDFDVATINNTQRTWSAREYARKFAVNGNTDYQEAMDFAESNRLPLGTAFALLAGTSSFSNIRSQFHNGEFKIKDKDYAYAVVGTYVPMTTLAPVLLKTNFLKACMALGRVKGFDRKRLLANAERCIDKMRAYSTRDAYLDMLEVVYNFGRNKLFSLKNEAIMEMRKRIAKFEKKEHEEAA